MAITDEIQDIVQQTDAQPEPKNIEIIGVNAQCSQAGYNPMICTEFYPLEGSFLNDIAE